MVLDASRDTGTGDNWEARIAPTAVELSVLMEVMNLYIDNFGASDHAALVAEQLSLARDLGIVI